MAVFSGLNLDIPVLGDQEVECPLSKPVLDFVSNPNRTLEGRLVWCWGRIGGVTPSRDLRAGLETMLD
jgi:hypothetical protein